MTTCHGLACHILIYITILYIIYYMTTCHTTIILLVTYCHSIIHSILFYYINIHTLLQTKYDAIQIIYMNTKTNTNEI